MRIAIALLVAGFPVIGSAQTVVSTTPFGTMPTTYDSKYYVSPDGLHVAVVKSSGSRRLVSVDGVDGEIFDSIENLAAAPSQGQPGAMAMVVFSPDGKRYAYGARRGGENFVIVDGKTYPGGTEFIFSPDSKRFAYFTGIPHQGSGGNLVLDGNVGPRFDVIREKIFSDDSKRFIYQAFNQGTWTLVVDGKSTTLENPVNELQMTPNGRRYAYVTAVKGEFVPVIDGVPQLNAGRGGSLGEAKLQISSDGKRWGFVSAKQANGGYAFRAVVDGKAGDGYIRIEDLQFSPDGKRFAYLATTGTNRQNQRTFVVLDGKRIGLEYNAITTLRFSPDSKHVAAFAQSDAGAFVLLDGNESDAFISQVTDFQFSNAGRHAYVARPKEQGNTQVYVDGKALGPIQELTKNTLHFSPDGTRLIYSVTTRYPETATNLDGKNEPFAIMTNMGPVPWKRAVVFSPDSKHVAFMSGKDKPFNLYVDMNPGVAGLTYAMPTFSADGRHFAVAGKQPNAKKWTAFVNGKAVAEFDDLLQASPETWQFAADGKLHLLAVRDKLFQKVVVDPQGSTLDSFTANMSKSGKTGAPKSASASQPTSVANNGSPAGAANNAVADSGVTDPTEELERKAEEAAKKKEALDKRLKKLKGLLGGKD